MGLQSEVPRVFHPDLGFSAAWLAIAVVPLAAFVGTYFMRGEERFEG